MVELRYFVPSSRLLEPWSPEEGEPLTLEIWERECAGLSTGVMVEGVGGVVAVGE